MTARKFICLAALTTCLFANAQEATVIPGHAHNDYEHDQPLTEALANGFISVEADVHLIGGELYVAHDRPRVLDTLRTLENLYLRPLLDHIREHEGAVYPGHSDPFYLMVDFKTAAKPTYRKLKALLQKYASMLSITENGEERHGPVKVFISGNRPVKQLMRDQPKLAGLDGRPGDLKKEIPASIMPVVSDNYRNILSWDGTGTIPEPERAKLQTLVRNVHAQKKKIRLWAAPDNPMMWKFLLDQGVDLINTDHLAAFGEFHAKYRVQ